MSAEYLSILICLKTKRPLNLKLVETVPDCRNNEGFLLEPVSGNEYPIINYIPRIVSKENYALRCAA